MLRRLPLLLALLGAVPTSALAQVTIDTKTKVTIIQGAVDIAASKLAEKEVNQARLALLVSAYLFQSAQRAVPAETATRLQNLAFEAWPEPVNEQTVRDQLAQLGKAIEDYRPRLTTYAVAMDFRQPHDNLSFEQWANYVIKAKQSAPEAEALATEYAGKVPNALLQINPVAQNTGAFAVLNLVFAIATAESYADHFLKNDILPRALKKADEQLARINPEEGKPSLLVMAANDVKELLGYARFVEPDNAQAKELSSRADAVIKRAQERYDQQVAENDFPGGGYAGNDKQALTAELQSAYRARFPNEKVLKFAITSDNWVERAEAWSEGDVIKSGIFRYLSGAVAVEKEDGRCRVYVVTFAQHWTGKGDTFGKPFYSATQYSYEMLIKNLGR